ncbi:MAG: GTPase Era [Deltaproteobacteria bacterium]|nr:GTPase Era [Deltaproteobacteria bacterium]MBW2306375.1 GTPase Era [Deltaproteobacteria bacterium]
MVSENVLKRSPAGSFPAEDFRSGFVSIVGRPNVGKSTLLNRLVGVKIVITSARPQTTRNTIRGIANWPDAQVVFLDTPGIHEATTGLNRRMVKRALEALEDVDCILHMIEPALPIHPEDRSIMDRLARVGTPAFLLINKIDRVKKDTLLPLMEKAGRLHPFYEIIPLSALNGDGVDRLTERILSVLRPGPRYFPEDILTDRTERFLVAEFIREKIFRMTGEEIPYCSAVTVEKFEENADKKLIVISATIHVERENQKGIIIGRGGRRLKAIGKAAREDLELILGSRIFLELFVRAQKNWRSIPRLWEEMGIE